jgi:uncharacterized membrane protein YfcA
MAPALLAVAAVASVLLVAYSSVPHSSDLRPGHRRLASGEDYYAGSTQSLSEMTSTSKGLTGLVSATVMILILGSLAAGAGIGGGGLFVPFYMILLDVSLNSAVRCAAISDSAFVVSDAHVPRPAGASLQGDDPRWRHRQLCHDLARASPQG